MEKLRQELELVREQRDGLLDEIAEQKNGFGEVENATTQSSSSQNSSLQSKVDDLRTRLAHYKARRQASDSAMCKARAEIAVLKEKVMTMEKNELKMRHEKIELRKQLREAQRVLEETRQRRDSSVRRNKQLQERIRSEKSDHEFEIRMMEARMNISGDDEDAQYRHRHSQDPRVGSPERAADDDRGDEDDDGAPMNKEWRALLHSPRDGNHRGNAHGGSMTIVRERAVASAVGVELHLEAIRKRVEKRLDSSRAALESIEQRAQAGLKSSQERLERLDQEMQVLESITK